MPLSFDLSGGTTLAGDGRHAPERRRVLVTGAAGRIGSYFAEHSHEKYALRLTDRTFGEQRDALARYGELLEGELHDLDFLKHACAGIDTHLHLEGNPNAPATSSE